MKKGLIKAVVLTVVFCITVIVAGRLTNKDQLDLTTDMEEASLPVIILYDGDEQINELHGYTVSMNATGMRDTITPLSDSKEIPLLVRTYGYRIDGISYEIRSIDSERLISDGSIASFQEKDQQIRTSIPVQSLLEQSNEYILTFKLKHEENTCYYYTRIADAQDCYVAESVKFAKEINDLTFSETPDALSTYWEPDMTGDNSTLQKVTINSSLTQAGWADLNCDRLTAPIPSIKEMGDSYNVILLNYVVTVNGDDGQLEYYNVEEYYRIRYTSQRMYLLNFERTMNQIFVGVNQFLYDSYLQLGIRSKDVEYMQNEAGTITCFVQEGDLWSYNATTGRLAEVFSFRGHEGIDIRENYMQHDIRILSMDEAGNIDYVVYGYMNRGRHEGKVGISFLHYNSQANTNEEKRFMIFDKSYQVLRAELGKLLYENAGGSIYLLFDGRLYRTDTQALEPYEAAEGFSDGMYAVSESNRYLAWISKEGHTEISIMDLENNQLKKIAVKSGKKLRVLGFLQEDLVYGVTLDKGSAGGQAPMDALRIADASSAKILKKYRKKGYYIDRVSFNKGILIIHRLVRGDNGYEQASQDSIVSRGQEHDDQEVVHTTVTEVKQTQVQLALAGTEQEKKPVFIAAKQIMKQENQEIALKAAQERECYFAYAKGKVIKTTTDIADAIRSADAEMGMVVDGQQRYIWKRARKNAQLYMDVEAAEADASGSSVAKCISAILKHEGTDVGAGELLERGSTPQEILESLLTGRKVYEIDGCSLTQILYYVNCGTPVLAIAGSQEAVLIAGYDALHVWLYDPRSGGITKKTLEEAEAQLAAAGSIYVAYQ